MQKSSIRKILIVEVEFQDDTHQNKKQELDSSISPPFEIKSLPKNLVLEHIKL